MVISGLDSTAWTLAGLRRAFDRKQLIFPGRLAAWATPAKFQQWLSRCRHQDWVVYSQRPFAGPEKVLDYLSRYTHRVAISNHRLRQISAGQVTFDYRDRRQGNQVKQLTVSAGEFIRRFLMHVLPPGFCRIRHYGFLGNRVKEQRLQRCRMLLGQSAPADAEASSDAVTLLLSLTGTDVTQCPQCQQGTMVVVERLPGPRRAHGRRGRAQCQADSS